MTDLFQWADRQERVTPFRAPDLARHPSGYPDGRQRRPAVILAFPITRHRRTIEMLARRHASYDDKRARFFLKQEIGRISAKRLARGIPLTVVEQGAALLERAVWHRIGIIDAYGGGGDAA